MAQFYDTKYNKINNNSVKYSKKIPPLLPFSKQNRDIFVFGEDSGILNNTIYSIF